MDILDDMLVCKLSAKVFFFFFFFKSELLFKGEPVLNLTNHACLIKL